MKFIGDYGIFLALGSLLVLSGAAIAWSGVALAEVDSAKPDTDFIKAACKVVSVKHTARLQSHEDAPSDCLDEYRYEYTTPHQPNTLHVSKVERHKRKQIHAFDWSSTCKKKDDDVVPSRWNKGDTVTLSQNA